MQAESPAAPDIRRKFWALFLDSTVDKDGQVAGFSQWWDQATDWQREQGMRYSRWTAIKIERDHRDPDECIAAGVAAFKDVLRLYVPRQEAETPAANKVGQWVEALAERFGWGRVKSDA